MSMTLAEGQALSRRLNPAMVPGSLRALYVDDVERGTLVWDDVVWNLLPRHMTELERNLRDAAYLRGTT